MKRALIASAVLYASAPLGVHFKARAAPKDMVAVTVNGQPIMECYIQAFHKNLPPKYQQIPLEPAPLAPIHTRLDYLKWPFYFSLKFG